MKDQEFKDKINEQLNEQMAAFDWNSVYDVIDDTNTQSLVDTNKDDINNTQKNIINIISDIDKKISDTNNSISVLENKKYKSNSGTVYAGDDDIHGKAMNIGAINENKKARKIKGFSDKIQALVKAKEIVSNYDTTRIGSIYDNIKSDYQKEDYIVKGKKMSTNSQILLDAAYDELLTAIKETEKNSHKFEEGGSTGTTSFDKATSASSRFKPHETIVFDKPIIGVNGNELMSYTWAYEWTMRPNHEGELVSKRISDWTQAQTSADTGRDIVHQFTIKRKDGTLITVSSESVPSELGYIDKKQMSNFVSIASAVKTLARQRMQLSILEAQEKEYNDLYEKYDKSKKPEIKEIDEQVKFVGVQESWKEGHHNVFGMGDQWYRQSNSMDYGTMKYRRNPIPNKETIEQLNYMWIKSKVENDGGIKPNGIYDLKRRIERQEKKVIQVTGSSIDINVTEKNIDKFEHGGDVSGSTPVIQNFTQFAVSNGYPSDYDVLEHGMLGSSGHVSKRAKDFQIKRMEERMIANKKAHAEYRQAIVDGRIIDPDGKLTKENIIGEIDETKRKEIQSKINVIDSQIKFIETLGTMSHLPNGKLKLKYQRTVDDYNQKKQALMDQLSFEKGGNVSNKKYSVSDDFIGKIILLKNTEKAPNYGSRYGQDVEPAGFYALIKESDYLDNLPNYKTFTFYAQNPLIIPVTSDTLVSWKKELSDRYKAKGKRLTEKLVKEGYDIIITQYPDKSTGEVIVLNDRNLVRQDAFEKGGLLIHSYQDGGTTDSPKMSASEFWDSLTTEQRDQIKKEFVSAIGSATVKYKQDVIDLENEKSDLSAQVTALYQKEKEMINDKGQDASDIRAKISEDRRDLRIKIGKIEISLRHAKNIEKAFVNSSAAGGIIEFQDMKGLVNSNIPSFTTVDTSVISFNEETILSDEMPAYIPFIDEEIFRQKGYVFDAIRVSKDKYIVAINGYKELVGGQTNYSTMKTDGGTHPTVEQQGYALVTLDQLVLINDYYYTKARALAQKEADEATGRQLKFYDSLSVEKREKFLNQKGYYHSLPVAIKKKITQPEYEALDLEGKEKLYKPYKRYNAKRLASKLEDNQMWVSFHNMYERFLNPEALPPKKGYANEEVFLYWRKFRDMMQFKIKDIKMQRESDNEQYKKAVETSFGDVNTNDSLFSKYGILVKRQDGKKIDPVQIEQIEKAWNNVQTLFGNLVDIAKSDNLKISHTSKTNVFASKAIGAYVPKMKTIAISEKYGNVQFESTFAHETAHYIDSHIGKLSGKRWITDDYESTAGILAFKFRSLLNKKTDSDYLNATKECFARALQQYFAITYFGEEAEMYFSHSPLKNPTFYFLEENFVNKANYYDHIKPLVEKFFEENGLSKYSTPEFKSGGTVSNINDMNNIHEDIKAKMFAKGGNTNDKNTIGIIINKKIDKFKIATVDGMEDVSGNALLIAGYENLDLFVHKNDSKYYTVTEKRTGAAMGSGDTAMDAAIKTLEIFNYQQSFNESYPTIYNQIDTHMKSTIGDKYPDLYGEIPIPELSNSEKIKILNNRKLQTEDEIKIKKKQSSRYLSTPSIEFELKYIDRLNKRISDLNDNNNKFKSGGSTSEVKGGNTKSDIISKSGDTGGAVMSNNGMNNDGVKGGQFVGKRHSQDGGIKAMNIKTGQPILIEDNEVIITRAAVLDTKKYDYEGESLTHREILSKINVSGGGVSFADGGEIPETFGYDGDDSREHSYNGKKYNTVSMLSQFNKDHECNYIQCQIKDMVKSHNIPNLDSSLRLKILHTELKNIGIDNQLKYGTFELNEKSYNYHFYIDLLNGNIIDYDASTLLGYGNLDAYFNAPELGRVYTGDIAKVVPFTEIERNELLAAAAINNKEVLFQYAIKSFNQASVIPTPDVDELVVTNDDNDDDDDDDDISIDQLNDIISNQTMEIPTSKLSEIISHQLN